jgi:hypothetical protein
MPDTETLDPTDKKDRLIVNDVGIGIVLVAARRECGEAIQRVLNTDMDTETKLELISKYAECFIPGKMQDDMEADGKQNGYQK